MAYRRMRIPGSVVRGRASYPLSLTVLSLGVMAALGTTAALAVCASPATQLTSATGTTETGTVTFNNLNNGGGLSVTVGGLGLTCTSATNAGAVAGFFASLSNGSTGNSLPTGCSKTGSLSGWTSGAASGSSVTFTSVTPNSNVADLTVSGNPSSAVEVQGSPSLSSSLSLNTVCVGSAGNWQNQEYHAGTGSIIDWKLGTSDPKDPTKTIGSWSLSVNTVVYSYTGAGSFTYTVWQQTNGSLDFCSGTSTVVNGTVKAGQGPCP